MKRLISLVTALLVLAMGLTTARAANVFLDVNGTAAESGVVSQAYIWDTTGAAANSAFWNSDAGGVGTGTASWVNGDFATLAAGTDATGVTYRMDVPAGTTTSGFDVQDGYVVLSGSALAVGVNPVRIGPGATLEIPSLSNVTVATNHVLTLDGGTLRNTVVGVGSGIWGSGPSGAVGPPIVPNAGTRIELTSNGGTLDTPNGSAGAYSIMGYGSNLATSVIGMSGATTAATLIKKGQGEFRGLNLWTFTTLDVQEGFYRINGTGGGETGFGAATGTIITHGGAVEDNYIGTALGTSIGITSPATRSIVLNNDLGPDTAIVLNAGWTINGPISGPGGLLLNGWTRKDTNALIGSTGQALTLGGTNTYGGGTTIAFGTIAATGGNAIPNTSQVKISTTSTFGVTANVNTATFRVDASETVGSLAGGNATRGIVNINGPAVTLTTGADNATSTFSGTISGTGGLTKSGTGTFTMDGSKTYTGNTTVSGGTLSTNSASLADAADVFLNTGSIFNLAFAATDSIRSLFINNVQQAAGTWGGTGSGATNISTLLTGTGLLNITTGPVVGLPGDFNSDGKVDAGDYVTWRKNDGTNNALANDNGLGTPVGLSHYNLWRANFASPPGAGSGLSGASVPEPTSVCMLLSSLGFIAAGRRRTR